MVGIMARLACSVTRYRSLVVLVTLLACSMLGDCTTVHPRSGIWLPTSSWRPGDPVLQGLIAGTLSAIKDPQAGYCIFVSSPTGGRTPIVWPTRFRAREHPLEVLNSRGKVFARVGHQMRAAGGVEPALANSPCMFGKHNAWYVQSEMPN